MKIFRMSEVSLIELRKIRARAKNLLGYFQTDLRHFVKADGTFRRKPDSVSPDGDVNVTTTCSCLMALALTGNFQKFFRNYCGGISADRVFETLIGAPWMSSGLNGNNAFTTTLVLRTFGFFIEDELFGKTASGLARRPSFKKKWELFSGIDDPFSLAERLRRTTDPAARFVWLSLQDNTRNLITKSLSGPCSMKVRKKLRLSLALDLQRLFQSGWIYDERIFDKASKDTKALFKAFEVSPTVYRLAIANRALLGDQFPKELKRYRTSSLVDIARSISSDPDNFAINDYSSTATVLYWFVDAVARAGISLLEPNWTAICRWAAKEFNHERSLVVAEHDAMMDPIAMGMAACLCSRLRSISGKCLLGTTKQHLSILPSLVELECSVEELFSKQTQSGIWNKYFPLFHYQDAGSNFCFTFELLEAVLYEFGNDENRLLDCPRFISGLEKAVKWCEDNRQKCAEEGKDYLGWNSGGYIETLEKGQPESWATAVVHMFLSELSTVISKRIQKKLLEKYRARPSKKTPERQPSTFSIDGLLDIGVLLPNEQRLSEVLKNKIIKKHAGQTEKSLRRKPLEKPVSALFFGPPGTSKTEMTKAIADDLGWPMVEITPSDFVRGTLANVYVQADDIFEDLMDLSGVVVFFDEMDALVQTRDGKDVLDITSQFLTTTMLPKLAKLHDQGQVVFFMATNYQDRFDAAIKRAGRFDLLICMGPPLLSEKITRLHRAFRMEAPTDQTDNAGKLIEKYLEDKPSLQDKLALFTFGEYEALLNSISTKESIWTGLKRIKEEGFCSALDKYSNITLRMEDLEQLKSAGIEWSRISDFDKATYSLRDLEKKGFVVTQAVRYFHDRKQSKEQ